MCADARLEVPFVVQLTTIDLNSDLGESFGRWTLGSDAELMKAVLRATMARGGARGIPWPPRSGTAASGLSQVAPRVETVAILFRPAVSDVVEVPITSHSPFST